MKKEIIFDLQLFTETTHTASITAGNALQTVNINAAPATTYVFVALGENDSVTSVIKDGRTITEGGKYYYAVEDSTATSGYKVLTYSDGTNNVKVDASDTNLALTKAAIAALASGSDTAMTAIAAAATDTKVQYVTKTVDGHTYYLDSSGEIYTVAGTGANDPASSIESSAAPPIGAAYVTLSSGQFTVNTVKQGASTISVAGSGSFTPVTSEADANGNTTITSYAVAGGTSKDTINVDLNIKNITIGGGNGNDVIIISNPDVGERDYGNTYVWSNQSSGNDTIQGWNATHDKLQLGAGMEVIGASMSSDGNDLILYFGQQGTTSKKGQITFTDVVKDGEIAISSIKVIDDKHNATNPTVYSASKTMAGDDKSNTIQNVLTTVTANSVDETIQPKSGKENDTWAIDGGKGNDTLINEGSYVSIGGGIGADYNRSSQRYCRKFSNRQDISYRKCHNQRRSRKRFYQCRKRC